MIEPLPRGQKLGLVAQVPFAHAGGGVTDLLEQLGDRALRRVQADLSDREQDLRDRQHPFRIAARHQRRARRRADDGGVVAGQLSPLGGHAVEVRRAVQRRAEGPDVPVTEIVDVDQDEVGAGRRRGIGVDSRGTGVTESRQSMIVLARLSRFEAGCVRNRRRRVKTFGLGIRV